LVTGGAGFIGLHLVELLMASGHKVGVVDIAAFPRDLVLDKVEFFAVDIRDEVKLRKVFTRFRPEVVCHLAALIDVAGSMATPDEYEAVNVLATLKLLELSKEFALKKFVFTSSAAVYGEASKFPIREDADTRPISFYGLQKLVAEQYIALYPKLSPLTLRFGNVFGPRQKSHDEGGVVGIFSEKLARKEKAYIYGDGQQMRDFIYVKDVAGYILQGIDNDLSGTFNCSAGKEIAILDLYKLMAKLKGMEADFELKPARAGELRRSLLDVGKIKKVLPRVRKDIKTALKETMAYFERKK
jgi:UDP-glucose 4-epimerase